MTDVMEQSRVRDESAIDWIYPVQLSPLPQKLKGLSRQMVNAEGVIESGMSGARVNEKRVTELTNVPEPLKGWRIDDPQGERIEPNRIPKGVADDLELVGRKGKPWDHVG
jgi:hypothetical protein